MDWKEDIGIYFAEKSIYRLKYLNLKLTEYINDWKNYVGEFDLISIDMNHEYITRNNQIYPGYWLSVRNKNFDYTFRFHINISYCPSEESSEYCLYMYWTKKLNLGTMADIKKNYNLTPDDEENFKWVKEEFKGPEICEKEYVLQLINNRVKEFFSQSLSIRPKE
jgi:hypothetical protein